MQIGICEENRRSPDPTPLSKQIGSLPAFRLLGSHFYPGFKFARAGAVCGPYYRQEEGRRFNLSGQTAFSV